MNSDIYVKTKGKCSPLFFPANKLIVLNEEQRMIITYSSGNSSTLYQGDDAEGVYQDVLETREEFWNVFQASNKEGANEQEVIKTLLDVFPYLTLENISVAKSFMVDKSKLYLPLLPGANSRIQVEAGKELCEVVIEEGDKTFIYVCKSETINNLPHKDKDLYKDIFNRIEFWYTLEGLIKGTCDNRVLCSPPIKDWYKFTPEVCSVWEEDSNVMALTPFIKGVPSVRIEEIEPIRKALSQRLREDFMRKVQSLI